MARLFYNLVAGFVLVAPGLALGLLAVAVLLWLYKRGGGSVPPNPHQ
jgi:hypothetical protein